MTVVTRAKGREDPDQQQEDSTDTPPPELGRLNDEIMQSSELSAPASNSSPSHRLNSDSTLVEREVSTPTSDCIDRWISAAKRAEIQERVLTSFDEDLELAVLERLHGTYKDLLDSH